MARLLAVVLWIGLIAPGVAHAQASCQLREVEGQKVPGGIDPRLEDVRALLTAPPFSAYATYKLLGTHPHALKKGAPQTRTLTNRHRYEVTFVDRMLVRDGRSRLRLKLQVSKPDGALELSTTITLDEGGAPFPRVEAQPQGDRMSLLLLSCS